jgi:diguanylate cyclase
MERQGLAPSPDNYLLWYSYAAGGNTALTGAIESLSGQGEKLTENQCRALFQQFFFPDERAQEVAGAARAVQQEVERLLALATKTADAGNRYDASLKEFSGELRGDRSPGEIRALLSGIIEQTQRMLHGNERLKQDLQHSAHEIAQLRRMLGMARAEAETDALTGLANRKIFDRDMRHAALEGMEHGGELSVIITDIDNFKSFNDQWGHLLGDEILKHVAVMLKRHTGEGDTAARFGGDEFAVLLPHRPLPEAVALAERMRLHISAREARKKDTGETIGRITCSFGVAAFKAGEALNDFLERADRALYEAKRRGRNQVADEATCAAEAQRPMRVPAA